MAARNKREECLYVALKTLTHYAACLEQECARLGNTALADPRNVTIKRAREALTMIDGRARP